MTEKHKTNVVKPFSIKEQMEMEKKHITEIIIYVN